MNIIGSKKNNAKLSILLIIVIISLVIGGCASNRKTAFEKWVEKPGVRDAVDKADDSLKIGKMYLGELDSINNLSKDQMKFDIYYLIRFLEKYVPDFMVKERNGVKGPETHLDYWFERVDDIKNSFDFFILVREISNTYRSANTGLVSPYDFKNIIQFSNHPDEGILNNARVILKNREFSNLLSKSGWSDESKSKKREDNVFTGVTEDGKTAYLKIKSFDIDGTAPDGTVLGIQDFLSHLNDFDSFIIDIRENQSYSTAPWRDEIIPRLIRTEKTVKSYVGYYDNAIAHNVFDYYLNMDKGVKSLTESSVNNRFNLDELELEKVSELPEYMLAKNFADLLKVTNFIEITDVIKPNNPVGFKGRIYLLQDAQVMSSGDTFSYYLRNLDIGTSVGKSAKGDGVARVFGLRYLALPYSNLIYRVETGYGFNANGSPNTSTGTPTDIYQENGPELDYVLDLIKKSESRYKNN